MPFFYFSVPFPMSDHFHVMCTIDATTIKQSEAQFRLRRSGSTALPTPFAPSTSALVSLTGGVTFNVIMAQLQRMDARLDTLTNELCQVNTRVSRIARRKAHLGSFVESLSPPSEASEDDKAFEDDDDSNDDDNDADGDASSSSANEMST